MTQTLPSDDDLKKPTWPGNVGTTFLTTQYHQHYVRVDPWASTGTNLGSGANIDPAVASAANGLHYLSNGMVGSTPIACEFVGRRDGSAAPNETMMWLVDNDDPFKQDDLDITWTFALDTSSASTATTTQPPGSLSAGRGSSGGSGGAGGVASTSTGQITTRRIGTFVHAPQRIREEPTSEITPTGWFGSLVGVRVQGAHVTNGSASMLYDDSVHENVDGYWLWVRTTGLDRLDPDADLDVRLYSTLAANQTATGVTRRLIARQRILAGVSHMNLEAPFTIRMTIDNVAGDPEIAVFVGPWDGGGERQMLAAALAGTVETPHTATIDSAGTVTDADATYQLTGQGTIAFGGYPDRVSGFGSQGNTVDVREGLVSIHAKRLSTGATLWREEFSRVTLSPAIPATGPPVFHVTDRFGNAGNSLESMWWWGENAEVNHFSGEITSPSLVKAGTGATAQDPFAYALIDPEGTGIPPGVAGADNRVDVVSLRPADDGQSQHRRITFRPGAQNAPYIAQTFYFGICLFGRTQGLGTLRDGIEARIILSTDATTGAQASVIAQINGRRAVTSPASINPAVIQRVSQTLSAPPNLLDGADHTLEFDCHVFENASGSNAPVVYVMKLDGTAVTWVEADIVAGANITIVSGSGELIDLDPTIRSGAVEAVTFWSLQPQTDGAGTAYWDPWRIHTWEQLALTTGAAGIPPDDQASIVLSNEGTAVGDLHDVLCEEFTIEEEVYNPSYLHGMESGHTAASPAWPEGRSTFKFSANAIDESQVALLRTFWDNHLGGEIPFTWTQDGASQIKASFVHDSLDIVHVGPKTYAAEFEIIELTVT